MNRKSPIRDLAVLLVLWAFAIVLLVTLAFGAGVLSRYLVRAFEVGWGLA